MVPFVKIYTRKKGFKSSNRFRAIPFITLCLVLTLTKTTPINMIKVKGSIARINQSVISRILGEYKCPEDEVLTREIQTNNKKAEDRENIGEYSQVREAVRIPSRTRMALMKTRVQVDLSLSKSQI